MLGDLHWSGQAVNQNRVAAFKYYIVAARLAHPTYAPQIFDRYRVIGEQLSENDRITAELKAEEWLHRFPPRRPLPPAAQ